MGALWYFVGARVGGRLGEWADGLLVVLPQLMEYERIEKYPCRIEWVMDAVDGVYVFFTVVVGVIFFFLELQ